MRRRVAIPLWVTGTTVALLAGLVLADAMARSTLASRRRELAEQATAARAESRTARRALDSARYDLAVLVSSRVVRDLAGAFVGYEQTTRRGNRFRITGLDAELGDGQAELRARADFDWRFGFYRGPIAAEYLALGTADSDGRPALDLRVERVTTLGDWPFFNRAVAPLLTLRMQNQLALPRLRLPLGVPAVAHELQARGARVGVPGRGWSLGSRRGLALLEPGRLGLVVVPTDDAAAGGGSVQVQAGSPGTGAIENADDDVRLALRLPFLTELLTAAVRGSTDLTFDIPSLPRVWAKPGAILGAAFDNHVDLNRLSGLVDITGCSVRLLAGSLVLDLALTGRFTALLEGSLYGVHFSVPVRLRPETHQLLPLRIEGREDGLGFALEPTTVQIPLELEASVAGHTLRFDYPLALPRELLARAFRFDRLVRTRLEVPVVVERGEVKAVRALWLRADWRVELPPGEEGFIVARGSVHLEAPR